MDGIETMKPMDAKKAIIKEVNRISVWTARTKPNIDAMFDITKESIGKRKGCGVSASADARRQL